MDDDFCILRSSTGKPQVLCDGERCPFWRAVEHVGDAPGVGCPIKFYQLTGNDEVAEWLLSVRARIIRLEGRDDTAGAG